MKIIYLLLTLLFIITISDGAPMNNDISYTSINSSVRIIGSLGQPLGKVIRISGIAVGGKNTKSDSGTIKLRVKSVDGIKLEKPVITGFRIFQWAGIKNPSEGKSFTYIGYETGHMTGIPYDAAKLMPRFATTAFTFSVYFQVCAEK